MVLGLIVVGGLASYSIYLQQDKAVIEFSKATNLNYHCLEDHEYIISMPKGSPGFIENKEKIQTASSKFLQDHCHVSFREWLPEDHKSWDQFVVRENNRKTTCTNYLNNVGVFTDMDIENIEGWNCEEFLKN